MFRLLYDAVVTRQAGKYINLSRCDPAKISYDMGKRYFHPVGGGDAITFFSFGIVASCNLVDPMLTRKEKWQKLIEIYLLEGEFERFVGAIGQIINLESFKAQFHMNRLDFSTSIGEHFLLLLISLLKPNIPVPNYPQSSPMNSQASPSHSSRGQPSPFAKGKSSTFSTFSNCSVLSATDIGEINHLLIQGFVIVN